MQVAEEKYAQEQKDRDARVAEELNRLAETDPEAYDKLQKVLGITFATSNSQETNCNGNNLPVDPHIKEFPATYQRWYLERHTRRGLRTTRTTHAGAPCKPGLRARNLAMNHRSDTAARVKAPCQLGIFF